MIHSQVMMIWWIACHRLHAPGCLYRQFSAPSLLGLARHCNVRYGERCEAALAMLIRTSMLPT
jgi:hypothetical protein